MRVAALDDIHGNLPVLTAVLEEIEREGWAPVGPDVDLRRTAYDVGRAVALPPKTAFPRFDEVFTPSLEGDLTAVEATAGFESKRGA